MVRYSFGVGLSHSFLDAGLSRRSRTTLSPVLAARPNGMAVAPGARRLGSALVRRFVGRASPMPWSELPAPFKGDASMSTTTVRSSGISRSSVRPSTRHCSGSWPATAASPARPTHWIYASSVPGAGNMTADCSTSAESTSNASDATSKTADGPAPRSPVGCAPLPGSTATPRKKGSSSTRRPCTSVDRASTTSPTSPISTATRSAPSWSPPDCPHHAITPPVSLLALNGLRVSEAIGADIDALGLERGHRTLTVLRKEASWRPCHSRRALPERSTS